MGSELRAFCIFKFPIETVRKHFVQMVDCKLSGIKTKIEVSFHEGRYRQAEEYACIAEGDTVVVTTLAVWPDLLIVTNHKSHFKK